MDKLIVEKSVRPYLDIAEKVLKQVGHPMHYRKIGQKAIDEGLLNPNERKTDDPILSMYKCIWIDIRMNRNRSRFRKTGRGEWGLNSGT